MMFNIIKVDYHLENNDLEELTIRNIVFEFFDNSTLIYCFNMSRLKIKNLLSKLNEAKLVPNTFHHAYKRDFFYDINGINLISTSNKLAVPIFQNLQFSLNHEHFVFFETKNKRKRIKEIIYFNNIEEFKMVCKTKYEIKYLVPFFYSNREMKELIKENRIKIDDVTILYLLEYKSIEGKKR